ncbi:hypothetical protein H920_02509 [Fukomys damarensis]|uniref:Uncharacterized protein n=1 Tax=Fukomys damarensis TaxID=885580 RepID=A0A091E0R2_FUKDA|nr:hypothetical protein H920_02509 [Fukomys damarensis]
MVHSQEAASEETDIPLGPHTTAMANQKAVGMSTHIGEQRSGGTRCTFENDVADVKDHAQLIEEQTHLYTEVGQYRRNAESVRNINLHSTPVGSCHPYVHLNDALLRVQGLQSEIIRCFISPQQYGLVLCRDCSVTCSLLVFLATHVIFHPISLVTAFSHSAPSMIPLPLWKLRSLRRQAWLRLSSEKGLACTVQLPALHGPGSPRTGDSAQRREALQHPSEELSHDYEITGINLR